MFTFTIGWVDCAGRTRTWFLLDPNGKKVAEICTKRDVKRLIAMLSQQAQEVTE